MVVSKICLAVSKKELHTTKRDEKQHTQHTVLGFNKKLVNQMAQHWSCTPPLLFELVRSSINRMRKLGTGMNHALQNKASETSGCGTIEASDMPISK